MKKLRVQPDAEELPPGVYRVWLNPGLTARTADGSSGLGTELSVQSDVTAEGDEYIDVKLSGDGPANMKYMPPDRRVDTYTIFLEVRPGAPPLNQRRQVDVPGIGRALPVTAMADRARSVPQHQTFYISLPVKSREP